LLFVDKREKLLSQNTLPEFFLTSASLRYGKTAYMTKDEKGRFRNGVTYAELMERSFLFAAGLLREETRQGDIVAMMSNPCVQIAVADIGTTTIGAITGSIFLTDSPDLMEYKLNHLEARIFVIENAVSRGVPHLDKLLSIPRARLPKLERVVVIGDFDPAADSRLVSFDDFISDRKRLPAVSDMLYQIEPEMPAVIIYSSGTEGRPKAAMISHHNIISAIRQGDSRIKLVEGKRYMDFLPPAHGFGYMMRRSIEGLGATIYPSHRDTLADDLPAVSPHIITGVPKFFMAIAERIRNRVAAAGMDIENLQEFQKHLILRAAGLGDVELVVSGAAALPDETVLFFRDCLGLRIDQAYGVTETSPGVTINTADEWKLGTVGKPFTGVSVSIVDEKLNPLPAGTEGEIAVAGDNVFMGYFKDEERTKKVLREIDGVRWYLTGDIGMLDDEGFLTITDRKDDMLVPTSGENVSSASVENKLAFHSRYIGYAVPYGTRRDYVIAVVWTDETKHENIIADARNAGIESDNVAEIIADERFKEMLEQDLRNALEVGGFNSHERPRGFVFLANPTDEEETGTLKARKKGVRKKFKVELDKLYSTGQFLKFVQQ